MKSLSKKDRMLLLKFVCAFAWADLEVKKQERDFVKKLVKKLELDDDEIKEVEGWLKVAPRPEEIDPNKVPLKHREVFLTAARQMIAADGEIDPAEAENLDLFTQLLR